MLKFAVSSIFVGAALLFVGASVANAAPPPNSFKGSEAQFRQLVKEKFADISKIQNKKVCGIATENNAACEARVVVDSKGKAKATELPANGYGPTQFLGAYNLTGFSSSTQPLVIAIVDAYDDPTIATDLDTYSSTYGIPQLPACDGPIASSTVACFQKSDQNGGTNYPATVNSSWALETSLDVEIAHAICQDCSIMLVEADTSFLPDLLTAIDTAVANNALVVSGSWGANEFSSETDYDSHFQKTGVAFTFSGGDNGYRTTYPAASQYVTAVGGTTLALDGNSYLSESAWNGTGSGCSLYEPKPAWQTDADCANRTMNDVSADADPGSGAAIYDSTPYTGTSGWFEVGGTSLSSPLIAGVYALQGVSSGIAANSLPYVYGNIYNLNDVAEGSNGSCGGSYLCTAVLGYDGPTGLGTPAGIGAFFPGPPDYSFSASPASQSVFTGTSTNYTLTTAPSGGFSGSVDLSVDGLPLGATADFDPSPLSVPGSSVMTVSVATSTAAGTYPLVVTAVSGSLTHTVNLSLVVSVPDFSVSITPDYAAVPSTGGTANYSITITPINGFNSPVTLTISSLPTGVIASFNPNPTTGTSSVLTLTVSSSTPTGDYPFTVTAVGGSPTMTHMVSSGLSKQPPPQPPFVSIFANPTHMNLDQASTTVFWFATNSTACNASGAWSGSKPTSGSQTFTYAAAGTYSYTLACTGPGGNATGTAAVTVVAPNFSISASPSAQSIGRGKNGSYTVGVNPTGGFTGAVTFSVLSGLPANTTASFSPNPTTSSSALNINVASKASQGTYTLTLKGVNGSLSTTTTVSLTITR